MSATELRSRSQISKPSFFRIRGQGNNPAPRVRLVPGDKPVASGRRAQGFTYLGLLIAIALMGFGLAAYGELYSHAAQREKEAELVFIGGQFRDAIASYYNRSPGTKAYPKKIDELLEDNRFPMAQHHPRPLYRHP